jgi:LPXTG-motif cell wall-anchored protein
MMQQRSRRRGLTAIGLGSIVAGALVLAGAFPGNAGAAPTQAQTPSSSVVEGNPNCGDLGEFDFEFKIDEQPVAGMTYDDPDSDLVITITEVVEGDPMTFSFESNIPVSAVFVKSGPGGILYTFDPPTTTGTELASPNDSISHVSFCWNEDQGTTTTTAKDTTTTTQRDTTTTTAKDTTTTTEAGSTTTSSVVPTSVSVPTTVAGATTPTTQRGGLPRTGSNTGPALAIGAGLLAGGVALVAATRRYRQS